MDIWNNIRKEMLKLFNDQRTENNCTIHRSSEVNMKYEKSWVPQRNNLNNLRDVIERVRMHVFNSF